MSLFKSTSISNSYMDHRSFPFLTTVNKKISNAIIMIWDAVTHHVPQCADIDYFVLHLGFNAIWLPKKMCHFVGSLVNTFLFSTKLWIWATKAVKLLVFALSLDSDIHCLPQLLKMLWNLVESVGSSTK